MTIGLVLLAQAAFCGTSPGDTPSPPQQHRKARADHL